MYRLENDIFLAHPKTGSTSVCSALAALYWEKIGGHHYFNDLPIRYALQHGGQVICTVRNMFEIVHSWWHTLAVGPDGKRIGEWADFDDFVNWLCFRSDLTWLQTDIYHFGLAFATIDVRYENIKEFWASNFGIDLPHFKKSNKGLPYQAMFSDHARREVEIRFKEDLYLTDYSYV